MNHQKAKHLRQLRCRRHVRRKILGTVDRPRLTAFRSSKHIYAQLIDDVKGVTLASASSTAKGGAYGGNIKAAKLVGAKLAEAAKAFHCGDLFVDNTTKHRAHDQQGMILVEPGPIAAECLSEGLRECLNLLICDDLALAVGRHVHPPCFSRHES